MAVAVLGQESGLRPAVLAAPPGSPGGVICRGVGIRGGRVVHNIVVVVVVECCCLVKRVVRTLFPAVASRLV